MTGKTSHFSVFRPLRGRNSAPTIGPSELTRVIALAWLLGALVFSRSLIYAETPGEIDQTGRWKRHPIDAGVNRDHGHSVGVGDLNGDGRPDAYYGNTFRSHKNIVYFDNYVIAAKYIGPLAEKKEEQ